jgi:DNA repair protein RadC
LIPSRPVPIPRKTFFFFLSERRKKKKAGDSRQATANSGHRDRLREKFLRSEFDGFHSHEIVELLLSFSVLRRDVKGVAKLLLSTFGSIRGIFEAEVEDLMRVEGVGKTTATMFRIIRAVNSIYLQEKCETAPLLNSSTKAIELWKNRLSNLRVEVLEVAYLDANLRLLKNGLRRLETGTAVATVMYPSKIARGAVSSGAAAVMIAHNHPVGPPEPSDLDERNTAKIKVALRYLDINLVDHIIIAPAGAFSFRENGLL